MARPVRLEWTFTNCVGAWSIGIWLFSWIVIGFGISLAVKLSSTCIRFLQWPVLILGVSLLFISTLGYVAGVYRSSCLACICISVMVPIFLLLVVFTIFTLVVTKHGDGQAVPGKGFKEYRLGDYSTWLQRQVDRNGTWSKTQSFLSDAKTCNDLNGEYPTVQQFNASELTPLESGCCKPPTSCGFTFVNATQWDTSKGRGTDADCKTWSNDPKALCFNCNSCKAAVLQNIKDSWRFEAKRLGGLLFLYTSNQLVFWGCTCCIWWERKTLRRY